MKLRDEPRRRRPWIVPVLLLPVVAAVLLATLRTGSAPEISIDPELPGFGRRTPVDVLLAAGGRGLGSVKVFLSQGEETRLIEERDYVARAPWAFWGEHTVADVLELEVGSETVQGLQEGEATLRVESEPPRTWLRRPAAVVADLTLPVLLRPPSLSLLSTQHYPTQGGAEAVVYRVGESSVRDGVMVGDLWFPGVVVPTSAAGEKIGLFAVPFDHDDSTTIRLMAEDAVGNVTRASFVDRFFPRAFQTDDIDVSEGFMAKVVPEILANTPELVDLGDLVENYVAINRDLRQANATTLRQLAAVSPSEILWRKSFVTMKNAQVMSAFADRRSYRYEGRKIDRQDHLGFDLASVRRASVPAANSGRVVLAEYFGIYGNAVVIDHGLGLMSLYGHLSEVQVEKGQSIERGQPVGRTGETGLAAGDHLHFTMLLRGEAVNPLEWWDAAWIRDRLVRKLGPALPFED